MARFRVWSAPLTTSAPFLRLAVIEPRATNSLPTLVFPAERSLRRGLDTCPVSRRRNMQYPGGEYFSNCEGSPQTIRGVR